MNRKMALSLLAGLLVSVYAAQAQEAYTIQLKVRGEGESAFIRKKESSTNKIKVTDAKGAVLADQNDVKMEISEYRETILKRTGDKRPTKLEREYVKHQRKVGDKLTDSSLQGKTVVIERIGDKYTFTYKGGQAIPPADAASLIKDFSDKKEDSPELNRLLLPRSPVKVGETWKLDLKTVFKALVKAGGEEIDVDSAKASGTGKLLKAYKKDGRQFGEVSYTVDVPIKAIGKAGDQLKFAESAKLTARILMDGCIDGTSEAGEIKVHFRMSGIASVSGLPGGMAALDVQNDIEGALVEPAKKKKGGTQLPCRHVLAGLLSSSKEFIPRR